MYPTLPVEGYALDTLPTAMLVLGALLGFILERAGMGSPKQHMAALTLKDPRSYRFLFAAVFTVALGLWVFAGLGKLDMSYVSVPELPLGPMLVAGALFGLGLGIGGFGPTLALVGLGRGRMDALGFLGGVVAAVLIFGNSQGTGEAAWQAAANATPMAAPAPFAPGWILAAALGVVGLGIMFGLGKLAPAEAAEAPQSDDTPKDEDAPEAPVPAATPAPSSLWLKIGPALVGVGVVALVVTQGMHEAPMSVPEAAASEPRATVLDGTATPTVDPLSAASWMVVDAHRVAEEHTPNAFFVDLRPASDRDALAIPNALTPSIETSGADAGLASAFDALGDVLIAENLNKPFVFVDSADNAATTALVSALREHGVNALLLEGGIEAWQAEVLDPTAEWPHWPVHQPIIVHTPEPEPEPAPTAHGAPAEDAEPVDAPEGEGVEPVAEPVPEPEPEPQPDPSVFDWEVGSEYQDAYRAWLSGASDELPPRVVIPGTVPLPTEIVNVEGGGGGGGGGCG